jgi:hypothetical protein
MDRSDWRGLVEQLRGCEYQFGLITTDTPTHKVEFDAGLSDDEVVAIECRFGFRFPPDLRAFLQTALPKGPRFPDWRSGDEAEIRDWLDVPLRGVLFDIEQNGFWLKVWGPRPALISEAVRRGEELVSDAPRLIPIFGHRMIPDEPNRPGNPVLSVHQTDIIHYGFDLADYLRHEFDLPGREAWPEEARPIRFWDVDQFQAVRWGPDGSCAFNNSHG